MHRTIMHPTLVAHKTLEELNMKSNTSTGGRLSVVIGGLERNRMGKETPIINTTNAMILYASNFLMDSP